MNAQAYASGIGASHRRMSNATYVRTLSTTCYERTNERRCIPPTVRNFGVRLAHARTADASIGGDRP